MQEIIHEFKGEDSYTVTVNGKKVRAVAPIDESSVDIPVDEVYKKKVKIDGILYKCIGIERFCRWLGQPLFSDGERTVGLAIEEVK